MGNLLKYNKLVITSPSKDIQKDLEFARKAFDGKWGGRALDKMTAILDHTISREYCKQMLYGRARFEVSGNKVILYDVPQTEYNPLMSYKVEAVLDLGDGNTYDVDVWVKATSTTDARVRAGRQINNIVDAAFKRSKVVRA